MTTPLYPDENQSLNIFDERNEHFVYHFNKRFKEFEERANKHINIAKASLNLKKIRKPLGEIKSEDVASQADLAIDRETGLIFGLGFDEHISRGPSSEEITKEEIEMRNLIQKLGYVDFRDFVALNKYILEAQDHESTVNQTKAKFLSLAMSKLTTARKEELRKTFKRLDDRNKELNREQKTEAKIDFVFNYIDGGKELFYDYYYKLKEMNQRDDARTENEFEKYEQMKSALNNPNIKKSDRDSLFQAVDAGIQYDLNDYMERIIKTYREQRTVHLQTDTQTILDKLGFLREKISATAHLEFSDVIGKAITLSKYQTFLDKYKKVYHPTNIETERLINKYLREKRLNEFTKEKVLQEEDPYFSPLTDEEELSREIYDEESKLKAMERHQMKKNYFEAKFNYQKKQLEESVDKTLADEMGIIITHEGQQHKLKDVDEFENINYYDNPETMSFIDVFLDNHYKSFKLDFMYNYLDFFSNKYRVRRRIAEELKNKVDLKEINYILNNLVAKVTGKNDLNKRTNYYSVQDFILSEYGTVRPTYIQTLTECSSGSPVFDKE